MKYIIDTVADVYNKHTKCLLEGLGFKFDENSPGGFWKQGICPTIEVKSLEELNGLRERFGRLILDTEEGEPRILIYDEYLE